MLSQPPESHAPQSHQQRNWGVWLARQLPRREQPLYKGQKVCPQCVRGFFLLLYQEKEIFSVEKAQHDSLPPNYNAFLLESIYTKVIYEPMYDVGRTWETANLHCLFIMHPHIRCCMEHWNLGNAWGYRTYRQNWLGHANLIPCLTDPIDPVFCRLKKILKVKVEFPGENRGEYAPNRSLTALFTREKAVLHVLAVLTLLTATSNA